MKPVFSQAPPAQRFLIAYSGLLTLVFLLTVYFGILRPSRSRSGTIDFDRIRAHRIDLVDPDGTERLILSNRAAYPGSFYHGQEVSRPDRRDAAGMLMINDEGTEDGGFIWGGLTHNGRPQSFSHLSFDQFEQDQTLSLQASLEDGKKFTGIHLSDVPDVPITPAMIADYTQAKALPPGLARTAAFSSLRQRYPAGHLRAALDRSVDDSVGLTLHDQAGHPRLMVLSPPTATQPSSCWITPDTSSKSSPPPAGRNISPFRAGKCSDSRAIFPLHHV